MRKVALEAVTAARMLADKSAGGKFTLSFSAPPGIGVQGRPARPIRRRCRHCRRARRFANYNPEAATAAAADRVKSGGYRAAVFSTSAQGRDLAPRVAARLDVSVVTDVLSVRARWRRDRRAVIR